MANVRMTIKIRMKIKIKIKMKKQARVPASRLVYGHLAVFRS